MTYREGERVIFTKRGELRCYDTEWLATYLKQSGARHSIRVDGQQRVKVVHDRNLRTAEHRWHPPTETIAFEFCAVCLVVKRADGGNGPCKGPGKLRSPEPQESKP